MTLAAKISMCLALWNPDVTMHPASLDLLSYWYNQEMAFIGQAIDEKEFSAEVFLSWEEFQQLFSLPNSAYIPIPVCIQSPSEEV